MPEIHNICWRRVRLYTDAVSPLISLRVASHLTPTSLGVSSRVVGKKRDGQRRATCDRIQKEFGRRFQRARKNAGLLQKNMAAAMDLTRTTISNIERGTQRLYLDQVFDAANVLAVPLESLLPSLSDVYMTPAVRTATDSPLPRDVQDEVARVVTDIASENRPHRRPGDTHARRND